MNKYLKAILFIIIPTLLGNLLLSIFYYNDIISNSIYSYSLMGIIFISFLGCGIFMGNKVNKKGYFEGLKFGFSTVIIFILLGFLFKNKININSLIYYLVLIVTATIGSMIGINKKKN